MNYNIQVRALLNKMCQTYSSRGYLAALEYLHSSQTTHKYLLMINDDRSTRWKQDQLFIFAHNDHTYIHTYIHTHINSIYKAPFHIDHGAEMENQERGGWGIETISSRVIR